MLAPFSSSTASCASGSSPWAGPLFSRFLTLIQRHRQRLALIPAVFFIGLLLWIHHSLQTSDGPDLLLAAGLTSLCLVLIAALIYVSVPPALLPVTPGSDSASRTPHAPSESS